jgi:hypothetical protein
MNIDGEEITTPEEKPIEEINEELEEIAETEEVI